MLDPRGGGESPDSSGEDAHLQRLPFDVYERYSIAARAVRSIGDPRGTVLDVGGYSPPFWPGFRSLAAAFMPDFNPVVADVHPGTELCNYVKASGMRLPFPDGSFGFVLAQDSLEHIPPQDRLTFLGELVRVSASYVLLCFPFRTPLNEACERLVFRYIEKRKGVHLPALREHAEFGLPVLDDIKRWMQDARLNYLMWTHGNSLLWLHMMLAKNHLWSQGVPELGEDLDAIFNVRFAGGDYHEPCYRAFILAATTDTAARRLDHVSGLRGELLSQPDQETIHSMCQLAMASVSSIEAEQRSQHIINLVDRFEQRHEAACQTALQQHNRLAESESRVQHLQNLLREQQAARETAEAIAEHRQNLLSQVEALAEHRQNLLSQAEALAEHRQNLLSQAESLAEHRQNLLSQQQAAREAAENDLRHLEKVLKQEQTANRTAREELETLRRKLSRFPLKFLLR